MSNTILKAVCRSMERIAPLRLAEKWDNVGLLLESPVVKPENKRVLLTIDLTPPVLLEALELKASVIVSYHPTIFGALKSVTLANPLQATLLRCAAEGISVFCPHTSLDSVWGGINDWLAAGVSGGKEYGLVSGLGGEKISPEGKSEGASCRLATLVDPLPFDALVQRIKLHLKLDQVQVAVPYNSHLDGGMVKTVAICAGSGGSVLLGKDAEVYFTGEMAHHDVLAAVAAGKYVILCGHTNTERGYLPTLAKNLSTELSSYETAVGDVDVCVSQCDAHPLSFV